MSKRLRKIWNALKLQSLEKNASIHPMRRKQIEVVQRLDYFAIQALWTSCRVIDLDRVAFVADFNN